MEEALQHQALLEQKSNLTGTQGGLGRHPANRRSSSHRMLAREKDERKPGEIGWESHPDLEVCQDQFVGSFREGLVGGCAPSFSPLTRSEFCATMCM